MSSKHKMVAFGVGEYGHVAQQRVEDLAKSVVIVGTTRSGKTRLANSLARQQSALLGSGQIIINAKPDPGFVREKARDAERLGKDFLHFTMAPKGGGPFEPQHPYQPPAPCYYDPLDRGSGAVRARMLIDAVVHSDASDVYRRTAIEISALAWDIARLSGQEWEVRTLANGGTERRKKRSMQVLLEMLDMDTLVRASKRLSVDLVRNHHPHLHEMDAQAMVDSYSSRAASIAEDAKNRSSIASSAIADTRSIVAAFVNSSAFYPQSLSPGASPSLRIDLLRAIVRGEIVLFDLSAADYQQEATMLASMILLDLQNTVSTLRDYTSRASRAVADGTPWPPVIVQIEELGSVANAASAESLIGLINKSADVGVRMIWSSQSLADVRIVDSTGEYLKRLLNLANDLIALQLGEAVDDREFCDFSGVVVKKMPRDMVSVNDNRMRLFTGAKKAKEVGATDTEMPRVPYGSVQGLRSDDDTDVREMVWITKKPELTAVHTGGAQGPNRWHEVLQMVPVGQPPYDYNPYADDSDVERSRLAAKLASHRRMASQHTDPLYRELHALNTARLADTTIPDVITASTPPADTPPSPDRREQRAGPVDPFGGATPPPEEPPYDDVPPDDPFADDPFAATLPDGGGDLPQF